MSAAAKLAQWRAEPVTFVREVLQAEPDAWQVEVLEAALKHNRIALKASKGPGKSTILSWIGWWFLLTRPHPKVVCTSITADNLRDNLWTEFAKWQNRSELLKKAFTWSAERIVANDHPETWWAAARAWPKDAKADKQADTLAGIHGDHVLIMVDESGSIPNGVVAAAEGALANADPARGTEAILIQAGNPTETSGPLYRACTVERGLWWVKEISGDPDDPNRAPRVSIQWARDQIAKYGRENPFVLVNVFGKFPPSQSNTIIGVNDASDASRRVVADSQFMEAVRILGVDVARFGDDRTVFAPRQGPVAFKMKTLRTMSTMDIADRVASLIDNWHPDAVFIDQTGVGAGVVDRLHQLHYDVLGVDNSSSPIGGADQPNMLNRRMECWWKMARWIRTGCTPDDPELIAELTAPTYKVNAANELVLEPKAEIKKRLGFSPDLADALALTFAAPVLRKSWRYEAQREKARQAQDYDPYSNSLMSIGD